MEGEEEETRRAAGGLARWKRVPEGWGDAESWKTVFAKELIFLWRHRTRGCHFAFFHATFMPLLERRERKILSFCGTFLPLLPFKKPASHTVCGMGRSRSRSTGDRRGRRSRSRSRCEWRAARGDPYNLCTNALPPSMPSASLTLSPSSKS